jgi:hypothetical protein
MCIMHINYHFDAVLVLHTRTASLVDAMEVQTCSAEGARPKFGIGVAGFAGGATEKGRCAQSLVARVVVIPLLVVRAAHSCPFYLQIGLPDGVVMHEAIVCAQEQLQIARRWA